MILMALSTRMKIGGAIMGALFFLFLFNPLGFISIIVSGGTVILALLQVFVSGVVLGVLWVLIVGFLFIINLIIGGLAWISKVISDALQIYMPRPTPIEFTWVVDSFRNVYVSSMANLENTASDFIGSIQTYVSDSWVWKTFTNALGE